MSIDAEVNIDPNKPRDPGTRFRKAMRKGFRDGFEEAGSRLLDQGEDNARDIVMGNDKVWNKKVKRGFETEENQFSRWFHWQGFIRNLAPHAEIVERGLAPAGEITGSKPSVQDILPWVDSEITPNSAAQERAEKANIGNWDVQLQALAVEYGKANVIAAFAIAAHIKDEGYAGIYFMEQTESYLQQRATNVKQTVEKNIRKKLKQKGLS